MLRVNKDHEEGNFKKRKTNFFIKVGALMLSVSLFSGTFSYYYSWINNLDKIVSVSSDVREGIYRKGDGKMYIETKDGTKVSYEKMDQDLNITEKQLSKVDTLKIDMTKNNDLSFLKHCDNLEWLIIKNSELLTENDLELLNGMNNLTVSLEMQMKEIVFNKNLLDFSKLNNCKVNLELSVFDLSFRGEIGEYILWDFSKSLPSNVTCCAQRFPDIDNKKYEEINEKIEDFIDTIDFSDTVTEEDKLLRIVEAVVSHIKFDEMILQQAEGYYEKSTYYNENLLSSVLTDSIETEGVCANYVALLSAICYKLGIESYYISASHKDTNAGHAWNLVKLDGNYKYVDLTIADSIISGNSEVNKEQNSLERFLNKIKADWYGDFNSEFNKSYELRYDPNEIVSDIEKGEVTYCNSGLDGLIVDDGNMTKLLPTVIGLGSGILVGLIYTGKNKKKELKETNKVY